MCIYYVSYIIQILYPGTTNKDVNNDMDNWKNEEYRQNDSLNTCKNIGIEPVHVWFHSHIAVVS